MNESHNPPDALDERFGAESDRAVEISRRRENLPFKHHAEVQQAHTEQDADPFEFCRRAIDRHFPHN